MIETEPEQEVVHVPSADEMGLPTFAAHMTKRHSGSLGRGASELATSHMDEYVEGLWRTFHDKLHNDPMLFPSNPDDHVHREPGYYDA